MTPERLKQIEAVAVESRSLLLETCEEIRRLNEQLEASDKLLVEWEKDQDALEKLNYESCERAHEILGLKEKIRELGVSNGKQKA